MDTLENDLESITAMVPRLIGAFHRQATRDLSRFGLTFPQFVTLGALEQVEGGSRMGPLATAALQSAASMTGIVDRLLERGLVERQRHPEDRRSVLVRLTDKGRDLLAEVKEGRQQLWKRLLGGVSPEDRQRIRMVMSALVEAMEKNVEA